MAAKEPPAKNPVVRLPCPEECGWYRDYTNTQGWKMAKYVHPVWGYVTQLQAAQKDIESHSCGSYLAYMEKLNAIKTEKGW